MRHLVSLAPAALLLGLSGAAAQTAPAAAELLFERPQWQAAAPGTALTYSYRRTSLLESVFGSNIDDRIRLTLDAGVAPANRTVRVDMFSQARRRAAGPFEDVSGNPVLVLFLEHHLEALAGVLKANPRYLKNAIRSGLRDRATVAPASIDLKGKPVAGWRIEVQPFAQDPNKEKMRGLESLTYTFMAADDVPGSIASIDIKAAAADGGQLLSETLTYDPNAP